MAKSNRTRTRTTAQKLKDPNLRATLPTSALTPAQQKLRAEVQRQKAIDASFASGPNYGRETRRGINAQMDLLYRPQLDEIDRQSRATQTSTAAIQDKTKAAYDALSQFAQGLGGKTGGAAGDYLKSMSGATRQQGAEQIAARGAQGQATLAELGAKRTGLIGERSSRRQSLLSEAITKDRDFNLTQQGVLGKAEADKERARLDAAYKDRALTVQERIAAARNTATTTAAETRADATTTAATTRAEAAAAAAAARRAEEAAEKTAKPEKQENKKPRRAVLDAKEFIVNRTADQANVDLRGISAKSQRERNIARGKLIAAIRANNPDAFGAERDLFTKAALDLAINGRISRQKLAALRQRGIIITADGNYGGPGR